MKQISGLSIDYRLRRNLVMCLIIMLIGGPSRAIPARYSFVDLGTLGGPMSFAKGINNLGEVVGYSYPSAPNSQYERAFFWRRGSMVQLPGLGGNTSIANDINDSHQIVGSARDANYEYATLWQNGQITNLGVLGSTGGYIYSSAFGINNSGQAVGASTTNSGYTHAFLWQGGGMTDLGTGGGPVSLAFGINNVGQVAAESDIVGATARHAFLVQDGVWTDLGTLPGYWHSFPYGINDYGAVVGSSASQFRESYHAFIWRGGTMTDINPPGGRKSVAVAINNAGQVVGTVDESPFIWENGAWASLSGLVSPVPGWTLREASAINDIGQIVGYGYYDPSPAPHDTQIHAFRLTPVPEPSNAFILLLGLGYLGAMLKRRKR